MNYNLPIVSIITSLSSSSSSLLKFIVDADIFLSPLLLINNVTLRLLVLPRYILYYEEVLHNMEGI